MFPFMLISMVGKKDFWSYRNYKEFNIARVKMSGSKLFKLMHGKEHRQFEKAGKLYSDFLKEQYKEIEPVASSNDKATSGGRSQRKNYNRNACDYACPNNSIIRKC